MVDECDAKNATSQAVGEKSTFQSRIMCDRPNHGHSGKGPVLARWRIAIFTTVKVTVFRCDPCCRKLEGELQAKHITYIRERVNETW